MNFGLSALRNIFYYRNKLNVMSIKNNAFTECIKQKNDFIIFAITCTFNDLFTIIPVHTI